MDDPFDNVEPLFAKADCRHPRLDRNPVTGAAFVSGLDPLLPQKRAAVSALKARAWFEPQRPRDAPQLPLSPQECERLKIGGVGYIVSLLGRSIARRDYRTEDHPRFEAFARGVMASPFAPGLVTEDPVLRRRYPPTPLAGLGPGCIWRPLAKPMSLALRVKRQV
ncbi:MAG: hypothetical protein GY788_08910 [bacterium]|nr:hypothetical protein [bacterium]